MNNVKAKIRWSIDDLINNNIIDGYEVSKEMSIFYKLKNRYKIPLRYINEFYIKVYSKIKEWED